MLFPLPHYVTLGATTSYCRETEIHTRKYGFCFKTYWAHQWWGPSL